MTSSDWTRPGAVEEAEGVFRIPLPLPNDGLRTVNVYVIPGPDGVVVVDSGWAVDEGRVALAAGLAEIGLSVGDISSFLVTHIHRDHYTLGVELRREFGMQLSLGEGERETMDVAVQPGSNELTPQVRHMRELGAFALADVLEAVEVFPDGAHFEPPDVWLDGSEVIGANGRLLDVVPTPGHTHGHVVFHDGGNRLLFAGDHVLPAITPSIGFEPVRASNPLGDYLGSLARVRALPDAMLLPAHGPVGPSVHARVDQLVEHHGVRLDQIAAAVRAGGDTAFEVASALAWTRHERTLDELNAFNQMLAIAETHAHLRLLDAQGRVFESVEDGVFHFRSL